MNKKYFLGMFAAAGMLLATSCSNDELIEQGSGDMATVSFNITTEGAPMSRAISDGSGANMLIWRVYDADGKKIAGQENNTEKNFTSGQTVNVRLAKGQTYKVAFWAQNKECTAYDTKDLTAVTVSYNDAFNNDENRDAFFGAKTISVNGDKTESVTLKRPFAQINVGVTEEDWTAAVASGVTVTTSSVTIENAATELNLLEGIVSGNKNVEYTAATIPGGNNPLTGEKLKGVAGKDYIYLSMCYVLPSQTPAENSTNVKAKFTFSAKDKGDIVLEEGLDALTIQRNWRTNIVGTLLTGNVSFKVIIDNKFENDHNKLLNVTPEELKTILTASENVTLTADYVVSGDWTPIDLAEVTPSVRSVSSYTLNGNGHTISGLNKSLFKGICGGNITVKGLTLANANVTLWDKSSSDNDQKLGIGAFVAYVDSWGGVSFEDCHLTNSYVTNTSAKAAAFVGYFTGNNKIDVKNCSVTDCQILSVDGAAAVTAYASNTDVNIAGLTVKNSTFTATEDREGIKKPQAGVVIGTIDGGITATISDLIYEKVSVTNTNALPTAMTDDLIGRIVKGQVVFNGAYCVTAAQLNAALSPDENGNITLDKDYVLIDTWTPANCGSSEKPIVINGNDHSISGLTAALLCDNYGFNSVTVKNLTIKDSKIAAGYNASGAIIAYINQQAGLTLENCHLVNSTVGYGYDLQTGGLVGMVTNMDMTIKDCSVTGSTINGGSSGAGIVGLATTSSKNMTIENCSVTGSTITSADKGNWRVGAMVGTANGNGTLTISGCTESNNKYEMANGSSTNPGHNLFGRAVDANVTIN